MNLLHSGYEFQKDDWVGGDDSLRKLCISQTPQLSPCSTGSSCLCHVCGKHNGNSGNDGVGGSDGELTKLRQEVALLSRKNIETIAKLNDALANGNKSFGRGKFVPSCCCDCGLNIDCTGHYRSRIAEDGIKLLCRIDEGSISEVNRCVKHGAGVIGRGFKRHTEDCLPHAPISSTLHDVVNPSVTVSQVFMS